MTCRKCGYRNDFLKECPFHEPPVAERIQAIRERKQKEAFKAPLEESWEDQGAPRNYQRH